jgi:PBP1b-binding outer membrane lipoprotein LpoB
MKKLLTLAIIAGFVLIISGCSITFNEKNEVAPIEEQSLVSNSMKSFLEKNLAWTNNLK